MAQERAFSQTINRIRTRSFDGDKHMMALTKKYPETGSEALWSYIKENIFEKQKQEVLMSRVSYAFETNFSSPDPMKTAREFKSAGYDIHLLFMGLNSLEKLLQSKDLLSPGKYCVSKMVK